MDGARYERNFARELDDEGFAVMRSPASGSATARDQPDLLAAKHGVILAIELKTTSKNAIYVEEAEVNALQSFSNEFQAYPALGARFKGDTTFYLVHIGAADRTDTGKYTVHRDRLTEYGARTSTDDWTQAAP